MEKKKTAVLIGATGLVGRELVQALAGSESYGAIVVLSRRASGLRHEKLTEHLIDFDRMGDFAGLIHGDHAFCCLGTTMKKAGSKANFRKVDYDYVLEFARHASRNGVGGFSLVSSIGASPSSAVFYSRVKGEAEEAVAKLPFVKVQIFRPSLLLGDRREKRFGEDMAKAIYRGIDFLLPARYKGIEARVVAAAMHKASLGPETGVIIYPSEKIRAL